ncbi:MAG: hypothetical protein ACI9QD_000879 [Thermoproteota archaeon]|jgi:hypothetical protein
MSWYYVQNGERQGPIEKSELVNLVNSNSLSARDFIWTKGFDNWKPISEVEEFNSVFLTPDENEPEDSIPEVIEEVIEIIEETQGLRLSDYSDTEKLLFIRIGSDRGGLPTDYGPYSVDIIKKLYNEKRINSKSLIFKQGLSNWITVGEIEDYEVVFKDAPPPIEESEKRENERKPFVARIFIQNNKKVFEGICRDISIGGMQVLVAGFPAGSGEKISMNVHPSNSDFHFVADGVIVRNLDGDSGFSFRFEKIDNEAKEAIQSYINAQ